MQLDYTPSKVGLKHPFRYINGVKIIKGRNTFSDRDYSLLKANDTFLKLIEESAITLVNEKAKTPKVVKEKVVVPEPIPEDVIKTDSENITTETAPTPDVVSPEEFTKLNYKEAIALVESLSDKDTLLAYQVAEQGSGVRIKVLKAIELKLNSLE